MYNRVNARNVEFIVMTIATTAEDTYAMTIVTLSMPNTDRRNLYSAKTVTKKGDHQKTLKGLKYSTIY